MANTLASHISASFIIKGTPIYKYGQLADAYSPCDFVYESAAGVWTKIDSDTAAKILGGPACVGYKERILSTGAKSSIDSAYATSDTGVPILVGFEGGSGEFVAHIEDPGAAKRVNNQFMPSDTEGVIEIIAAAGLGAGDPIYPIVNVDALANGDLYMKARWI